MFKRPKRYGKNILTLCAGLAFGIVLAGSAFALVPSVSAQTQDDEDAQSNICTDTNGDGLINAKDSSPQEPCLLPDELESTPDPSAKECTGGDCSGLISKYVNPFIRILSALVGIIVTISIIIGGVQYSAAGGDPGKVAAAKKRIYNAILALLAYLFMLAFLNWILPGGIV